MGMGTDLHEALEDVEVHGRGDDLAVAAVRGVVDGDEPLAQHGLHHVVVHRLVGQHRTGAEHLQAPSCRDSTL